VYFLSEIHAFSIRFLAQFKLSKNSSYPIGSMLNFEEISVLIKNYAYLRNA